MKTKLCALCITTLLFTISGIEPLYAYLDPGTGSFIFQILIAGLLGALFTIKKFWKNITRFFRKLLAKGENND